MKLLEAVLRRGLIGIAIAVGLAQSVGAATGFLPLQVLGNWLASSPLPQVFHYDEIAIRVKLEAGGTRGEILEIELTPEVFSRLRGPMTRRGAYTKPLFAHLPEHSWLPMYRHGLCGRGPVARELGIQFDVAWVDLHVDYRSQHLPGERTLEIHCPR